jgi:phosphatidylglycerophosphate synthase
VDFVQATINPATWVTLFRLALVPCVFAIPVSDGTSRVFWLAIIGCAALSDVGDGWIARRYSMETTLGYYLDLAVDRAFLAACLLVLLHDERLPIALVGLILIREFFVLGLHGYAAAIGSAVPSTGAELAKSIGYFGAIGVCVVAPAAGRVVLWVAACVALAAAVELTVKIKSRLRHR